MRDFPDGPGSHDNHEITIARIGCDAIRDRAKVLDRHRLRATRHESLHQILAADARAFDFAVAHEIDRRHDDKIRAPEALRKLFQKKARAAVLMWLENADQSPWIMRTAERCEGALALRRMVAVIVEDRETRAVWRFAVTDLLHAAVNAREGFQAALNIPPRSAEPRSKNRRSGGVQCVVFADQVPPPRHQACIGLVQRALIRAGNELHSVVGRGRPSERLDSARKPARHGTTVRPLMRDEQLPAAIGLGKKSRERTERLHDLIERTVAVKMILFDVVDQRERGPVRVERTVELACFGDEDPGLARECAGWNPLRSCSGAATKLWAVRADDHRRIKSCLDQQVAQQSGRGALAVRSCDGDCGASRLRDAERLRVVEALDPCAACSGELRVALLNGCGEHNKVCPTWDRCSGGAHLDLDAVDAKRSRDVARLLVAAGDECTAGAHHARKSAGAAAADANEVHATTAKNRRILARVHGEKNIGIRRRSAWNSLRPVATRGAPYTRGMAGGSEAVRAQVLIVDDEKEHAEIMAEALRKPGHVCTVVHSRKAAEDELRHGNFDVIVTDLVMETERSGLEVLEMVGSLQQGAAAIMVTAHGDVATAKEALRGGAYDFIEKPLDVVLLRHVVQRAAESVLLRHQNVALRGQVDAAYGFEGIIGDSAAIRQVIQSIRQVAPTNIPVLITGESGTGKELVAHAIHLHSKRRERRFVPFNAAGQAESLLEDQLFGHVRGAFTGADRDREGVFEYGDRGTVFLDEIGDMPLSMQPKLLRVLEKGEIVRLGANDAKRVDVRFVSATNRDLKAASKQGQFREDLFYRLRGVEISIPPLRERREDIPLLVRHAVGKFARELERPIPSISESAMLRLVSYHWPGNVRELVNAVHRMLVGQSGAVIDAQDVPAEVCSDASAPEGGGSLAGRNLERLEKETIRQTLALAENNRELAAQMLGIGERTLYRKLKEYGLR